jgi:hypothetical protein
MRISGYSTRVNVSRMADRKLYSEAVAEKLRIAPSTWRGYCTEAPGRKRHAPPPDGTDVEKGHARPWWWESTIDAWKEIRPGRGHRTDLERE